MSVEDRRNVLNDVMESSGGNGIDFTVLGENGNNEFDGVPFLPPELEQRIEYKIDGITIHLDKNGNFSGINECAEIVRGEELKEITRKALESGYFQLSGFDPETIKVIDNAVYGNNAEKQISHKM